MRLAPSGRHEVPPDTPSIIPGMQTYTGDQPPSYDAALVRAAQAGDDRAIERLLGSVHDRLLGRAARKIGPEWQGRIDPDDLLQETYIQAVTDLPGFTDQGEESFYRWISTILDHRFIDAVRKHRAKKRGEGRVAVAPGAMSRHESFLGQCLPDLQTPSVLPRRQEAVAAMMVAIARLDPDQRKVVQRLMLDQESISEIARDMGRSEDAVRRLGSRAVEKLRGLMGDAARFLSVG